MTLIAVWLTTFAVCVVSAFVPLVNAEVYLLSASALSPREFVLPLIVAATLGQMVGKVGMFFAGRGVLRLPQGRIQRGLAAVQTRLEARPKMAKLMLLSSATVGLPPLYLMSIAAGTVGMGLASFFLIGTLGRLVYYSGVVLLPQVAKALLN